MFQLVTPTYSANNELLTIDLVFANKVIAMFKILIIINTACVKLIAINSKSSMQHLYMYS